MSGKLQPMALTSINTWPGPGIGSGTSAYCISDGSPHCVAIMAFMLIDHTMIERHDRERTGSKDAWRSLRERPRDSERGSPTPRRPRDAPDAQVGVGCP